MTLEDIYLHRLADLQETEEQLIQSILGLRDASISPDLREALQMKLQQTSAYRQRLEHRLETARPRSTENAEALVADSWRVEGRGNSSGTSHGNGHSGRNLWELTLASFLETHGVTREGRSAA